ncbi:MAG: hypothetical protein ACYCS1_00185 [Gammaproteobacteria bacterium]
MHQAKLPDLRTLFLERIQDINRYLLQGVAECWRLAPGPTEALLPPTAKAEIKRILQRSSLERERVLAEQDPEVPLWLFRSERSLWLTLDRLHDTQHSHEELARIQTAASPWGAETLEER